MTELAVNEGFSIVPLPVGAIIELGGGRLVEILECDIHIEERGEPLWRITVRDWAVE